MTTATLLVVCPDQKGLVARLSGFVAQHHGNIVHADSHTDGTAGKFLSRIEWQLDGFDLERAAIMPACASLAHELGAAFSLHFSDETPRLAIWVSKQDHCLLDLLWRQRAGEFRAEVAAIFSNHADLKPIADQFGIPYHHLAVNAGNKQEQEAKQVSLLKAAQVDVVILAKYMQILSPSLLEAMRGLSTINIHHSFLPAFAGEKPYHRAYQRGVKIIGATAHYVTEELDEGPIIDQDVVRISHRDEIPDLIRKGKDLERVVLARAVRAHLGRRVLVYGNKTVVFE